jgi:uncharacterized protein involved in exopolysaccharide biosynthesis
MYEVSERPLFSGEPRPTEIPAGRPIEIARLLRVLRRAKWWLFAAAVLGGIGGAPLARLVAPLRYEAQATVAWNPTQLGAGQIDQRRTELLTILDTVELPANLAIARKRLRLKSTIPEIGAMVKVEHSRDSDVIRISARAVRAELAAALANTIVDAFLQHQKAHAQRRKAERRRVLEADLAQARQQLARDREAYDRFRVEHGVADLSVETQRAIEEAAELRAQANLARLENARQPRRPRQPAAQEEPPDVPVSVAPVAAPQPLSPEEARLAELENQLGAARLRFTDEHPNVRSLAVQVEALRLRMPPASLPDEPPPRPAPVAAEVPGEPPPPTGQRRTHLGAAPARASEGHSTYDELAAEARSRLGRLSALEGEGSSLLAAQSVAEAHLRELEGEHLRSSGAGESAREDFSVLARASVPERAESRKAYLAVAILAPFLAVLLAALGAVALALRGLRVYTATEVAYWGRAPVIASAVWPRGRQQLGDLLREVEDYAPEVRGRTLVVPATEKERAFVDLVGSELGKLTDFGPQPDPSSNDPQSDHVVVPAAPTGPQSLRALPAKSEGLAAEKVGAPVVVDVAPDVSSDDREDSQSSVYAFHEPRKALATRKAEDGGRREGEVGGGSEATSDVPKGLLTTSTVTEANQLAATTVPWLGPVAGPELRRAARLADRVLVVLTSGTLSATKVAETKTRLGRGEGVGFLLVGLSDEDAALADRAGAVEDFWHATRR